MRFHSGDQARLERATYGEEPVTTPRKTQQPSLHDFFF